jgi:hypothetical protein
VKPSKFSLALAAFAVGAFFIPAGNAQVFSDASKLKGKRVCSGIVLSDGSPLVWSAAAGCWGTGGNVAIGNALPTAAVLIAPNFTTALPAGTPGSLARFFAKAPTYATIAWFGNSTVQGANELFTELATYAGTGGVLAGMTVTPVNLDGSGWVVNAGNIINQGHNGATLASMLGSNIQTLCNTDPDLVIIRGPLINDVRGGATSLPQSMALVRTMLDQVTACAPWADILLTTENSLLTTDPGSYGWVSPATALAAQTYSTILQQAILPFAGAYPHVVVYDLQTALFGATAPATSTYMLNQLHPGPAGRTAEADLIAGLLAQLRYKPLTMPNVGSNLLAYSTDFSHWTNSGGVTIAGTLITLPSAGPTIYQAATVTPGLTYTASFWAKRGTSTALTYNIYDATHSTWIAQYASYYALTNATTWTRVSYTFTAAAGCTSIRLYVAGSGADAAGTVYLDHVMLNLGSTALPWVPGTTQ